MSELTANIGRGDSYLHVDSNPVRSVPASVVIGTERMLVIAASDMLLVVERGHMGSPVSTHSATDTVTAVFDIDQTADLGSPGSSPVVVNPMTTAGDIITAAANGVAQRLAKGSDGNLLTMTTGAPAWAAPVATPSIVATGAGAPVGAPAAGKFIYLNTSAAFAMYIWTGAAWKGPYVVTP